MILKKKKWLLSRMSKFKRFCHWPREEKRYFFLAYYWLTIYSVKLKTTPFKKLIASPSKPSHPQKTELTPQRIGQLIRSARKYSPFPCLCLVQALTAKRLLTRLGFDPVISLGVNNKGENNTIEAHAWCKVGENFTNKLIESDYAVIFKSNRNTGNQ